MNPAATASASHLRACSAGSGRVGPTLPSCDSIRNVALRESALRMKENRNEGFPMYVTPAGEQDLHEWTSEHRQHPGGRRRRPVARRRQAGINSDIGAARASLRLRGPFVYRRLGERQQMGSAVRAAKANPPRNIFWRSPGWRGRDLGRSEGYKPTRAKLRHCQRTPSSNFFQPSAVKGRATPLCQFPVRILPSTLPAASFGLSPGIFLRGGR